MDRDVADLVASVLADPHRRHPQGLRRPLLGHRVGSRRPPDDDGRWDAACEADPVLAALGRRPATDGARPRGSRCRGHRQGGDRRRRAPADHGRWRGARRRQWRSPVHLCLARRLPHRARPAGRRRDSYDDGPPCRSTTTFITPLLAHVGLTEKRGPGRGLGDQGRLEARRHHRSDATRLTVGDTRGMVKVVVDAATDLVLGATIFCVDSHEIINLVALADASRSHRDRAARHVYTIRPRLRHSTTC